MAHGILSRGHSSQRLTGIQWGEGLSSGLVGTVSSVSVDVWCVSNLLSVSHEQLFLQSPLSLSLCLSVWDMAHCLVLVCEFMIYTDEVRRGSLTFTSPAASFICPFDPFAGTTWLFLPLDVTWDKAEWYKINMKYTHETGRERESDRWVYICVNKLFKYTWHIQVYQCCKWLSIRASERVSVRVSEWMNDSFKVFLSFHSHVYLIDYWPSLLSSVPLIVRVMQVSSLLHFTLHSLSPSLSFFLHYNCIELNKSVIYQIAKSEQSN